MAGPGPGGWHHTKSTGRRRFAPPIITASSTDLRNFPVPNTPKHRSGDDAISGQPEAAPDLPRSEPEIIPPGVDFRPGPNGETGFYTHRSIRIHVTRPGPFGIAAIVIGAGIVGALGFLLLLGTLLIGAAAAGTLIVVALVARLLARFRA